MVYRLINGDADEGSTVAITAVTTWRDASGTDVTPTFAAAAPGAPGTAIDFAGFGPSAATLAPLVTNVRFDDATGRYTAELRVRNDGTADVGRRLAAVLTGLPTGVSVVNASGTDTSGASYFNLTDAVPTGGLAVGKTSDAVLIEIDNPAETRFDLALSLFDAGPNSAPTLTLPSGTSHLGHLVGEHIEIAFSTADADGDDVSVRIKNTSGTDLPNFVFDPNGLLTFAPAPGQEGTYTFDLVATDGMTTTSQSVTFGVAADTATSTRLRGSVLDTASNAIAGITIELAEVHFDANGQATGNTVLLVTTTDSNGVFTLDNTDSAQWPSGTTAAVDLTGKTLTVLIHGDEATTGDFPYIAERVDLLLGRSIYLGSFNDVIRPIYLPEIDTTSTVKQVVDTTTVEYSNDSLGASGASITFANGSDPQIVDPSLDVSITEVPTELTPAALPSWARTGLVVTIQPGDIVFTEPAALTLPNVEGFGVGALLDLWSIDPDTGDFANVGKGQVVDNGDGTTSIVTIEGGVRTSSWHFFGLIGVDVEIDVKDDGCDECEATAPGTSEVSLHGGELTESHTLPVAFGGGPFTPRLTYNSNRAAPKAIVQFTITPIFGTQTAGLVLSPSSARLIAKANFGRGVQNFLSDSLDKLGEAGLRPGEYEWEIPASALEQGDRISGAVFVDLSGAETGTFEFELEVGLVNRDGDDLFGTTSVANGIAHVVNNRASDLGNGWGLSGLFEVTENPDGSVLMYDGESELYFAYDQTAGTYLSPPGDFSTLVKDNNGTTGDTSDDYFVRTTKDQMVYRFDAGGKLATITDRNQNTTTFAYSGGRLASVTDPAGRQTLFESAFVAGLGYRNTNNTGAAGRETTLGYDTDGNLVSITDPETETRTFSYDIEGRMTGETNELGETESVAYNEFGQVVSATRKDGGRYQYQPAESVRLGSSTASLDEGLPASYTDPNGNVFTYELDSAGQARDVSGGEGFVGGTMRNADNLVTSRVNARGDRTTYAYDQ
ncbi:MAG: Ig-like domain-containing protein, partial [Planctomycetota bacterium]